MSTQLSDATDLTTLANSLRQQLAEPIRFQPAKGGRKPPQLAQVSKLQDQVAKLLDLLDESPNSQPHNPSPPSDDTQASPNPAQLSPSDMLESLDRSLAQWQAQITLAYSQGAARELADQLQTATLLNDSLKQREAHLESQRQCLEQATAELLQQQARTQRQRRLIAQELRAQKAEWLLECEQQRQNLANQAEQQRQDLANQAEQQRLLQIDLQMAADNQATVASQGLEQELSEVRGELERSQRELQETMQLLQELEQSQADKASDSGDTEQAAAEQAAAVQAAIDQAAAEQAAAVQAVVDQAAADQAAAVQAAMDQAAAEQAAAVQAAVDQATADQAAAVQAAVDLATADSAAAVQAAAGQASDDFEQRIAELEARLLHTEQERQDLMDQNFDLASQVAKHQVVSSGHTPHVNFDASTLSWEERRKLIMRQLEDEQESDDAANAPEQAALRVDIENVLRTTQDEIERRDAQIAELQSIIEQQSDTRQGVAIGAAAFAQAFDSDEIIQQERQKLKEIQQQWEDKLRQAEIDVSLERAKLARERIQLEQELETTQREKEAMSTDSTQSKKRKWLEHLGLREEHRNDK